MCGGRPWGKAIVSEEKKEIKLIVKEIKEVAGVFYISQDNFIIVVQVSRKARSVYIPKCCGTAGPVCIYKEGQLLLEDFPLPQFFLKYIQLGDFIHRVEFGEVSVQISPLVTFSNERSLNQFDRCLYPPPLFPCFTFTEKVYRKKKVLTDSRGH